MSNNLIICYSPFQVLLAKCILEKDPNNKYIFIMAGFDNYKNQMYFNKLKGLNNVVASYYISIQKKSNWVVDGIYSFYILRNLIPIINHIEFDNIYVANIDKVEIRYFLGRIRFKILNTFDDGTSNIYKNSFFYLKEGWKKRLFDKIMSCVFNVENTLEEQKLLINKHYTIFLGFPNIIDNIEYLYLFDSEINVKESEDEICVFLGQPLKGIERIIRNIQDYYNIDLYFPHPRETNYSEYHILPKIVRTDLIFEDYIIELLNKNRKVKILTLFSGAALSVSFLPNVDVEFIYIDNHDLRPYRGFYNDLESKGFNITEIK